MALSDKHLPVLNAAYSGDAMALEQLMRLCQPDIRRYAQRACFISDVDDAVQEALLVLARRLKSVRMLAAFSGWMFKIVQRECRRLGRQALRHDPYDEQRAEEWFSSHNDASLRIELIRALDSLPHDYRHIILLRDFKEASIAEIAQELEITPAAAKSRLHRARTMAREYLVGS